MLEDKFNKHVSDTTAMITESNPLFALSEIVSGMSVENSINSRLFAGGIGYLGFAKVYSGGRDLWRRKFGVNQETSELKQFVCDAGYSLSFSLVFSPIMYSIAGERDLKTLAVATGTSMILGVINGALVGYALDVSRDLVGICECNRKSYPNCVKNLNTKFKKLLFGGLIVGSVGFTNLVYENSSAIVELKNEIVEFVN